MGRLKQDRAMKDTMVTFNIFLRSSLTIHVRVNATRDGITFRLRTLNGTSKIANTVAKIVRRKLSIRRSKSQQAL